MSGGGSPKTTTVVEQSNSSPWVGAQPALHQSLGTAQTIFQGGMPEFYPGKTNAGMSAPTAQGLAGIAANAGSSSQLANQQWNAATGAMNRAPTPGEGVLGAVANGGGANPWQSYFSAQAGGQNPFLGAISGAGGAQADMSALNPFITGAASNPSSGQFTAAAGAPVGGPGMDTLSAAARGELMQNPWLDATFNRGAEQIRGQLDTAFARAGRSFGNENYGEALAGGLSDFATQVYGGAYETDMGRRMTAAGDLAAYEQGGVDRMLGALGAEAGLSDSQLGRWFDAATMFGSASENALNRGLTASGMGADAWLGTRSQNLSAGQQGAGLYDQDIARALDAYLAVAGQRNADTGYALDAARMLPDIYNFANNGARDLLGVGASLEAYEQADIDADRARYDYNANADRANVEWLNAIASGAGQLGGSSSGTSGVPYQGSNGAMQAAGIISAIAGIASMFSDRRLKEDVAFVGADDDGNRIYRFRYAWDDPAIVRYGVMADEVDPRFVVRHESGFDMVNPEVFA